MKAWLHHRLLVRERERRRREEERLCAVGSFSTAAQPNQSIEPIVRRSMWSRENEKQLKRKDEWKKERVENKLGGSASGSTLAPLQKKN